MATVKALKGWVSGRVQGVWFRASVQQGCRPLGLTGYAKNLPDGRVEVLLVGTESQLAAGRDVVANGSPNARVDSVEWRDCEVPRDASDFQVL